MGTADHDATQDLERHIRALLRRFVKDPAYASETVLAAVGDHIARREERHRCIADATMDAYYDWNMTTDRLLGGTLDVSSRLEGGTSAVVALPLPDAESGAIA